MEVRKTSKKRNAILDVLCSTKTHPTASWVHDTVKKVNPAISIATVYRNLRQLKDDGTIISVGQVLGEERFDGVNSAHSHFICENCGKVVDVNFDENIFNNFNSDGNLINFKKTCFYGLCKDCKNN